MLTEPYQNNQRTVLQGSSVTVIRSKLFLREDQLSLFKKMIQICFKRSKILA